MPATSAAEVVVAVVGGVSVVRVVADVPVEAAAEAVEVEEAVAKIGSHRRVSIRKMTLSREDKAS